MMASIDTIDYMGDWMDKVFEMELSVMFNPNKDELYAEAKRLSELVDTEYAEKHEREWELFEADINGAYDRGDITAAEFNELATTAFYDYFNLKGEEQ